MSVPRGSRFRWVVGVELLPRSEPAPSANARPIQLARISLIALLLLPHPITPAVISVSGGCTLVNAITAANSDMATLGCSAGSGADEIRLTADVTLTQVNNTTPETGTSVDGPNGLPQITTEIVVKGYDHSIARADGAPEFRIFNVAFPGDLTLENITLSNGGGASFDYQGGAIANAFTADITLTNSTVSGNSAGGFYGGGGGILNKGTAVLTNTTLSGNSAYNGGGLSNYGIATLTNSTLSANSGGTYKGGAIDNTGTVTLTNTTFSGNSGGGGAINVFSGKAYLANTLLADSSASNCRLGSGMITDNGGNLADDTTCVTTTGTIAGTLNGVDPILADNGGPTRTHALLEGSNAIGLAATCGLATDQRGAPRPTTTCDSGAYEFISCPDLPLSFHTVVVPETKENCQNIVVGPDYIVAGTGALTLQAGRAVILGNDTTVDPNGQLTIELDTDLQLIPPPP